MKLSDTYRKLVVKEIQFAATKMKQASSGSEILYYFSAVFGVIQRVFNIEYDPELVYVHFLVRATYEGFMSRLQLIQKGADTSIPLLDEQFVKLTAITKELGTKISKGQGVDATLRKFVLLLFTTTGNGYYLVQKGMAKI